MDLFYYEVTFPRLTTSAKYMVFIGCIICEVIIPELQPEFFKYTISISGQNDVSSVSKNRCAMHWF